MISICIATYNGEKYIEEQLLSILNQTRQADEVIICDDNSLDNTKNIIEEFIKKYNLQPKWRLISNKQNKGYPFNFYFCIDNSKGDIVFFSDQDDIWVKDKIERMGEVLNLNPNIQLLSCNYGVIDSSGQKVDNYMTPKTSENMEFKLVDIEEILRDYKWPGMTMAIRKLYYNDICNKFNQIKIAHDFILSIFAADIQGFYYYDYIGAYHRRHDNNVAQEEHRILKLLNLKRKLHEIQIYNEMLQNVVNARFDFNADTSQAIRNKLELSKLRYEFLKNRKFIKMIKLYFMNMDAIRIKSFICDFWILCFGSYKKTIEQ